MWDWLDLTDCMPKFFCACPFFEIIYSDEIHQDSLPLVQLIAWKMIAQLKITTCMSIVHIVNNKDLTLLSNIRSFTVISS